MNSHERIFESVIQETRTITGNFNIEALMGMQHLLLQNEKQFTPLFIYGSTGLGKTHLLNFAKRLMVKQGKASNTVLYFDDRGFQRAYVDAMYNNSIDSFKSMFNRASLLLLDDFHLLDHKQRAQEQLKGIFDELKILNTPIVATGTEHPKLMRGFQRNLRSRICGGLAVKITSPLCSNQIEFLNILINKKGLVFTDEAKKSICKIFGSDFLQLTGVVNRLELFSKIHSSKIVDQNVFETLYKGELYE